MCVHIWKFYQCHTWSTIRVEASSDASSLTLLLTIPACSQLAASHHKQTRASPLFREFSATLGKHEMDVDIDIFQILKTSMPLEWSL